MADHYDPDDAFENGMWNSDAEPYDVQHIDYFEQPPSYGSHMRWDVEPEPQPKRIRRWPWVLLGFLVVMLIAGGIYGFHMVGQVNSAKAKAQTAISSANNYMKAAKEKDSALLQKSATDMSTTAHELQSDLQGPGWSIAAMVPVVGSDIQSVRVLSDVLVDVSDNALLPLAQNSGVMNLSNLIGAGSVNVGALSSLAEVLDQAGPVITRSASAIEALPKANIPQVSAALESVRDKVKTADDLLTRVGPIIPNLPSMLGANGQTKNYLVLAQNNSEIHATGGFAGSIGHLRVTDGNIEMGEFEGVNDALNDEKIGEPRSTVSAGATEEEKTLFSNQIDVGHGDHNYTPDFTRVGEMYFNINKKLNDEEVDGVIGFDVVFLQYMLRLVGGIDIPEFGETVDGNNAAPLMLNECLFRWSPELCDQFYSEVSKAAFNKILSGLGKADNSAFFNTLIKSADEGRCLAWMRDPAAEEALKKAGFAGELGHDPAKPMVNVVTNDFTISKGSYYLSVNPQVGEARKNADGSTTYPMTVTLRNNMSRATLEAGLPSYIQSKSIAGSRSDADLLERVILIGPEDGRIENINFSVDNSTGTPSPETKWDEFSYQGLDAWHSLLRLDVGEQMNITFDVVTSPQATEQLKVRKTPVIPPEIGGWPA